ncbi:MAG: PepSY domain-containing protein [Chloroflexota bacterium]|nr:PepSY domain-containing protein [Chloroflexota bacterium]
MFKRILVGGGAAGALTAAYLVGSLSLGAAFAQTTPSPSPSTTTTAQPGAPAATQTGEQADTANETSEAAALASQAKITSDQAKAAALAKFPGATVGKIELDSENGGVAYSVQLTDSAGTRQDVSVDATSGNVLATQAEGVETPGAPEGPETGN